MIRLAKRYNRYGRRCRYYVNERPDLLLFKDNAFDFIYSIFVLQHMPPECSLGYIREFIRVMKVGGLAVFQLPIALPSKVVVPVPVPEFCASVTMQGVPRRMQAGGQAMITCTVRNVSSVIWPGPKDGAWQIIRLGNHWLGAGGQMVVPDDGRTLLPRRIEPQEQITLPLDITAPAAAGCYVLEIDMVQEGVAWFGQKGSKTAREPVMVVAGADDDGAKERRRQSDGGEDASVEPRMEMHAIGREEVVGLLEKNGARAVHIEEAHVGVPPCRSCWYFVTR